MVDFQDFEGKTKAEIELEEAIERVEAAAPPDKPVNEHGMTLTGFEEPQFVRNEMVCVKPHPAIPDLWWGQCGRIYDMHPNQTGGLYVDVVFSHNSLQMINVAGTSLVKARQPVFFDARVAQLTDDLD